MAARMGRVVGGFPGRPEDPSWDSVVADATTAMQKAAGSCKFKDEQVKHRRGNYPALDAGVSYGGGQQVPTNLKHTKKNGRALQELRSHPAMVRLAGFGSSALATYAPRVHRNIRSKLGAIHKHNPSLRVNFTNSIFPGAAFNFGPSTVCFVHVDWANDSCGFCHVVALGDFDPQQGGHLVLFPFKLVVEFPPGSSILLMSAVVLHANTPIQLGETRMSFTQYCAGGLLRWVDAGFRTQGQLAQQSPKAKMAFDADADTRLAIHLELANDVVYGLK
ncbi:hypothetical protein C8Q79DRAFT_1002104 [Trametes meyenii]|nr:hypothetical protein C8Q79DRAFT_1002104 [Trametes meyenii]